MGVYTYVACGKRDLPTRSQEAFPDAKLRCLQGSKVWPRGHGSPLTLKEKRAIFKWRGRGKRWCC